MRAYLEDQDCSRLFATSEKISGEFFLEGMDIRINISDTDLSAVEYSQKLLIEIKDNPQLESTYSSKTICDAKEIYAAFMQAHNHELAHLYQVLALPAFQLIWVTRYNLLRFEAVVMLRYFEENGVYIAGKHKGILQILTENKQLQEEFGDKFNEFYTPYKNYLVDYKKKHDGISLFYIIESMAHVISLQLSEEPETDTLNIGTSEEYSKAFLFFESKIESDNIETRWKYLLFVYICYFSCQEFIINNSGENPVDVFFRLCGKAPHFLESIKNRHNYYKSYARQLLKEMNIWGIPEKEIEISSDHKLASIFSFFEVIDLMEEVVFPNGVLQKTLDIEPLHDFINASEDIKIDWNDKYILARMMIFPFNFVWTRDIYDAVMENNTSGKEFTYSQEADFYRFILNCKHLLNEKSAPIICCPEHGGGRSGKKIVRCTNEGGLGFYISTLTGKPAHKLFLFG